MGRDVGSWAITTALRVWDVFPRPKLHRQGQLRPRTPSNPAYFERPRKGWCPSICRNTNRRGSQTVRPWRAYICILARRHSSEPLRAYEARNPLPLELHGAIPPAP